MGYAQSELLNYGTKIELNWSLMLESIFQVHFCSIHGHESYATYVDMESAICDWERGKSLVPGSEHASVWNSLDFFLYFIRPGGSQGQGIPSGTPESCS